MPSNKTPKQDETPDENLAEAIKKISAGMEKLTKSGLTRKAVVILLKDTTGVGKKEIEKVLTGLSTLAGKYTVPS